MVDSTPINNEERIKIIDQPTRDESKKLEECTFYQGTPRTLMVRLDLIDEDEDDDDNDWNSKNNIAAH